MNFFSQPHILSQPSIQRRDLEKWLADQYIFGRRNVVQAKDFLSVSLLRIRWTVQL